MTSLGIWVSLLAWMLLYGGEGSSFGGASSCPCDFCGNTTYCNKMEHTIVPIGIPKQGVNRLLLDNNNITELRSGSFKQMFSLTELVLNNNKINQIDPKSLADLGNLLYLYLDNNEIRDIHEGTLLPLAKLKRLFLDGNRLTTLPSDVPQLDRLERISLERNAIKAIDWTSFVRLKSLRLVKIWTGNPVQCSCNTLELIRWLDDRPKLISGKYQGSCERSSVTCTQAELLSIRHYAGNATQSVYDSGGRLHVHCDVSGVPLPMVVWRHPAEGYVYPYKSGRIESFRNGTLAIDPLSYNDSGRYVCYAIMGDMKNVGSLQTTLRVSKFNPRVVVTPDNQNIYVALGKQASLACVVSSNRAVTLEWFRPDNLMVQLDTGGSRNNNDNSKYRLLNGGKTLEISDVTADDLGTYKCVASNQLGVAEAEIELAISESNLLLMILCGCGGALLVLLMIAGGCVVTRMRQKRKIKSSQVEEDELAGGVGAAGAGGRRSPRQHDWVTSSSEEQVGRVREELPQPFTCEPEVKGFRL